ncbi:hypothetical protein B0H11DRAFT_2075148 [Mycena galericulata]|nr:hypothetical protein B0H11DRAFT_2075148 [Mycena galericulata]
MPGRQLEEILEDLTPLNGPTTELVNLLQETKEAYLETREDLERFKLENARLAHSNHVLSRKLARCPVLGLPPEILLSVFRLSSPPWWLLKGEREMAHQSIYSTALSMKLSIINVCKTWHQVGIEILYRSVLLRSIGQLPAFVRALEGRDALGLLVRNLDISFFVPRGYSVLFESETKRLYDTSLEYTNAVDFAVVIPTLVELCGGLRALALALPLNYSCTPDSRLTFPKLEDLRVRVDLTPSGRDPSVWKWPMPKLRRIWVTSDLPALYNLNHNSMQLPLLLDVYGRNLTFLSMCADSTQLHALLGKCPAALVVGDRVSPASISSSGHLNVKYVDVWHKWHGPQTNVESGKPTFNTLKVGFPALRACRYFDVTFGHLWDLPVRFPPGERQQQDDSGELGSDSSGEELDVQPLFLGSPWLAAILEFTDPASIFGWALSDVDSSVFEPEEPQTFDFFYGTGPSDSENDTDSDAGSCDTDSMDDGLGTSTRNYLLDEFDAGQSWEVDREEALEIFSKVTENW